MMTRLEIFGCQVTLVPLVAVADIRFGSGPAQINRYDRARQVSVEANLQALPWGDVALQ